MPAIDTVAVGDVDTEVLEQLARGLAQELAAEVAVRAPVPLPPDTYNAGRCQYSSTEVLRHVSGTSRPAPGILLAVTSADLYVPELNFVFGEAHPATRSCIISLARLGVARADARAGSPAGRERLLERALTEAIHEIGHVLGLGHCSCRTCVMFFSNSILDTDRKGHRFCDKCCQRAAKSY